MPANHRILDDGWMLVTKKKAPAINSAKSKSLHQHRNRVHSQPKEPSPHERPACAKEVAHLKEKVERYRTLWREEEERSGFLKAINDFLDFPSWTSGAAFCAGLGTFDPDAEGGVSGATRCLRQLAFFLDSVDALQAPQGNGGDCGGPPSITMLAQDPKFTSADKALLGSYGVQASSACTSIDDRRLSAVAKRTFVFAPFLPWPALPELLGSCRSTSSLPALYVGTPITAAGESIEHSRIDIKCPVEVQNLPGKQVEGRYVTAEECFAMWQLAERVKGEMKRVWVFGESMKALSGCEVWVSKEYGG